MSFLSPMISSARFYFKGLYSRFREENVFFFSSGLAFKAILCIVPLLLLFTSLLGLFLQSPRFPMQRIDEVLDAIFPAQPYAQKIRMSLKEMIVDLIRYRSTFGISGIGIFAWTATSLFSASRIVVNKIYRIATVKLAIIRILEDIGLVILVAILFVVANAFTWLLLLLESFVRQIPSLEDVHFTLVVKSFPSVLSYLSALIMFFVINRFVPDKVITNKVAMVSAFTTTSLWWIAGKGFGWYLSAFHPYSKLYGAYAFLLVFLLWIYYSATVFVVGMIVGQLYRERNPLST